MFTVKTSVRVSSGDFQRQVGRYADIALTQPVMITSHGRDRTVLISAQEYARLKRRDRDVLELKDFTDEDLAAIEAARAPAKAAKFDIEIHPKSGKK